VKSERHIGRMITPQERKLQIERTENCAQRHDARTKHPVNNAGKGEERGNKRVGGGGGVLLWGGFTKKQPST